ncbi:retrovirus-related pol polyprotein from transposon TNT 1-94 [Tanacetum coccineum]
MKIKESLNVTFDETPPPYKTSPLVDDDLDEEEAIKVTEKKNLKNDIGDEPLKIDEVVNIKESRKHPLENVNVNEALTDKSWIIAMQEELNQFVANNVWDFVPQPKNMTNIGTKWVFRNKLDENGIDSRNKARVVSPVARLEFIRILLAYACALDFKLFQMDVKSAFLNNLINEEVYMAQPPGFIDFKKPVARLESIRILLAYNCALDFKLFQMDVKSAFLNGFINEEVLESVRYGVSNGTDNGRVSEFLGVGTTFDIFQNIHFLYLQYGVLVSSGYGVLIIFPSWSLVSAGTDTPYLP